MLLEAAEGEKLPHSLEAAGRDTRTDAESIFNAGAGITTALVSGPNRYMHSPSEMVALEDLDRTARLLAAFVRRVEDGMDFIG
jgi:endoglucanase